MRQLAWLGIGLFCATIPILAWSQSATQGPLTSPEGKPWPAPVDEQVPMSQPVLAPQDAIEKFTMPPGFHLELVAAEPLVSDPVLSEFDADGRLWVLEMHGFAVNEAMDNSFEPINDLVILEDTDEDGVFDKRTVFMDKLIMPRAFKVLAGGCALVGEPPHLWKACDTDGDLQSDSKELISDQFATQGVVEHGANGLMWAMDNTITIAQNDWDLSLKGGKATIMPALSRGQWGLTQDDAGRVYRIFNTDPLYVDYLKPAYYARNPNMVRTRGLYDLIVDAEKTRIWPARPTFGVNRGYRTENYREDGSQRYYGGVSGPMIYRGTSLPEEMQGQPFVVDGPTNIVHLLRFDDETSGKLEAVDFYDKGEFVASTDERFRPVSLTPGWDGSFYIVDMYRGVSQDGPLQTDYLRNYILERDLWQGIHYGRIYRVVRDGMETHPKPHMSSQSAQELVGYLSSPDGWWRDRAQELLVQRGDSSVLPALAELARSAPDPRTRLQALWTMDGLGATDPKLVDAALEDEEAMIRAAAVRLSEDRLRAGDAKALSRVLALANDPQLGVRRQVAASLGELPAEQRIEPLMAMLERDGDDPVMIDAVVSGLAGLESRMLDRVLAMSASSKPTDAMQMLAGAIGRGRDAGQVQRVLAVASDAKSGDAVRSALLAGLQDGLKGPGRSGRQQPGDTGPGPLRLAGKPDAIIKLAEATGPMGEAAKSTLAQLDWPGKPAAAATVPMNPDEEKLFAAGGEIYANTCSGCHTAQGRGSTIAKDLAGSREVNAQPDVLARILLSGKEGSIGLMPPAGAAMSDQELASIMTFVRGSWGNTSSPVQPDTIKEWRAAYAHRKTPWTDEELAQ